MIENEQYMEELRDKYKEFNLNDSQVLQVESLGLTPEQLREIIKILSKAVIAFEQVWNSLMNVLQSELFKEKFKEFKNSLESLTEHKKECILSNKAKSWEKKRFYQ